MVTVAVDGSVGAKPGSTKESLTLNASLDSTIESLFTVTFTDFFSPLLSPFTNITAEPTTFEKSPGDNAVSPSVENLFQK